MTAVGPAFSSDRAWDFDDEPADLWARIAEVDRYEDWWPWLRRFEPHGGFRTAARWGCEVAPPLPYVVRFTIALDRVEQARRADATVSGDIRGTANLTVEPRPGGGAHARLVSKLAPANPVLRTFGLVARPLVEWGHDWVLDQGQRQFVQGALRDR